MKQLSLCCCEKLWRNFPCACLCRELARDLLPGRHTSWTRRSAGKITGHVPLLVPLAFMCLLEYVPPAFAEVVFQAVFTRGILFTLL